MLAWTAEDFAKRGISSSRLDAELLISEALSLTRVRLYMDLDRPLVPEERDRIRELVKRRRAGEPVAYILGRRAFYGRELEVSAAVLVPRPDTETLVERALMRIESIEGAARVLDLCTGSGAVGLTLAAERPEITVDLTDVSAEALAVARRNAERLEVTERVRFFEGDLWDAVPASERYDLVVANPPYVTEAEMEEVSVEVRAEPRLALVAGPDGFAVHDRLVARAREFTTDDGGVLVEVGAGQADELARRFESAGWAWTTSHDDLGGIARVVEAAPAERVDSRRDQDREHDEDAEEREGAEGDADPDQPPGHT